MNKLLSTIIALFFIVPTLVAQKTVEFPYSAAFGMVPQYTASGGLRFDIDMRISKKSNQWLIVSPQVYMLSGDRFLHDINELTGFGLDVKHKIYIKPNAMKPEGFYVQYGVMFQHFAITDERYHSYSYIENGVEYFGVTYGETKTQLNKFGGNFHLGYQWIVGDRIYVDLYAGPGIRLSKNNISDGFDTLFNDYWVDYGYSGTLLDAGFRIGFYF